MLQLREICTGFENRSWVVADQSTVTPSPTWGSAESPALPQPWGPHRHRPSGSRSGLLSPHSCEPEVGQRAQEDHEAVAASSRCISPVTNSVALAGRCGAHLPDPNGADRAACSDSARVPVPARSGREAIILWGDVLRGNDSLLGRWMTFDHDSSIFFDLGAFESWLRDARGLSVSTARQARSLVEAQRSAGSSYEDVAAIDEYLAEQPASARPKIRWALRCAADFSSSNHSSPPVAQGTPPRRGRPPGAEQADALAPSVRLAITRLLGSVSVAQLARSIWADVDDRPGLIRVTERRRIIYCELDDGQSRGIETLRTSATSTAAGDPLIGLGPGRRRQVSPAFLRRVLAVEEGRETAGIAPRRGRTDQAGAQRTGAEPREAAVGNDQRAPGAAPPNSESRERTTFGPTTPAILDPAAAGWDRARALEALEAEQRRLEGDREQLRVRRELRDASELRRERQSAGAVGPAGRGKKQPAGSRGSATPEMAPEHNDPTYERDFQAYACHTLAFALAVKAFNAAPDAE